MSKYRKYMICFQEDIVEDYATGKSRVLQPLLNCEFDRWGSLHPWEVQVAMAHWQPNREGGFQGLTVDEDEMTLERPEGRLSVFDTDQFAVAKKLTADEKAELEKFLVERSEHGQDYILVVAPALVAPWPNYDKIRGDRAGTRAEKISRKVQEDGYDVGVVVAYERSKKNEDAVVVALEGLVAAEDEPLVAA